MAVNYKAWINGNYIKEAGWLLQKTGLDRKKGVTKKTADKLVDIIKTYKNMREIANYTRWSTNKVKYK